MCLFLSSSENQPVENDDQVRNAIDESTWHEETADWNEFETTQEESTLDDESETKSEENGASQNGNNDDEHSQGGLPQANNDENNLVALPNDNRTQDLNVSFNDSVIFVGEIPAQDVKPPLVAQGL